MEVRVHDDDDDDDDDDVITVSYTRQTMYLSWTRALCAVHFMSLLRLKLFWISCKDGTAQNVKR